MRLGVAIPCFIKHIDHCYKLLDSINEQSRLPDQVIVSCSSSKPEDFVKREYKFPLTVITSEERKNSAQNRNIAASKLDTDVISFIDADDIMHPQRLEVIENAFKHGANPSLGKSYIHIKYLIDAKNKKLIFSISNNKPGALNNLDKNKVGGIGLKNVQTRLNILYPGKHELNIVDDKENYSVTLILQTV